MKLTLQKQKEIFNEFRENSIEITYFFNRELILFPTKVFEKYGSKFFSPSFDVFNHEKNYRSNRFFTHIHAVSHGNLTQVHIDYGNIDRNPLNLIPHFFLDVIPYFVYHLIMLKKPYHIAPEHPNITSSNS